MVIGEPGVFVEAYEAALREGRLEADRPAVMRAALLVSPDGFRVSDESARDNRYMVPGTPVDEERAHAQHQGLVRRLLELGVPVVTVPGRPELPDAVYPNNVYATIPGRFIVGRMRHEVRRREARREDVRSLFVSTWRYELRDLSEREDLVAELTGPLVIDRPRGIGFAGLSTRLDAAGAEALDEAFSLRLTLRFELVPEEYHTNLVLAVFAGRGCVLHAPSFRDGRAAEAIARLYGHRVVWLSDEEKAAFCGNAIAVTERDVMMSRSALRALRPASRAAIEEWGFRVHGVEIDELEKGGGSLRCLIAEVF